MLNVDRLKDFLESRMPTALDILRQMVEINSYTANRTGVNRLGRFTAESFASLGFTPEFIPCANREFGDHLVLTRCGDSTRNLALISHLDTVFPPEEEQRNNFHWQREGNRIFGPGTQDIKGGTVMIWLVLSALRELAPKPFQETTWRLLWNAAEERVAPDFGDLCRNKLNADTQAALIFEAEGRLGHAHLLVTARKGRAEWCLTVEGRGAHAGGKHPHGANAIVQLAKTIERIAALTDYQRNLTFNVGAVSGGTVLNRVPHEALVRGEFRAFASEAFQHAKTALLALAGPGEVRSPADGFPCQVKVELTSETRPWLRNSETDRLLEIWRQAGGDLGIVVDREERGGLSDGNLIWDAVPTLDGLGPWGDNDHCSERSPDGSKLPEFVEVSSFVPKAILNVVAILKLLAKA